MGVEELKELVIAAMRLRCGSYVTLREKLPDVYPDTKSVPGRYEYSKSPLLLCALPIPWLRFHAESCEKPSSSGLIPSCSILLFIDLTVRFLRRSSNATAPTST